ncbi:MAG: hypothetical protein F6J97_21315 [Leptolyngbya sp. SIO4C1]|nr:hypothetical protein [Leptolyngbya sp. SIO4C1]
MPRKIDKKCLACVQLSPDQARVAHGPDGDGCWDERRCHRRRSHYRKRRDINEKRRVDYARSREQTSVETISIEVETAPLAYLYLYREKRKDAPLHAIAVSVWQDSQKVLEIEPIHCSGMRNRQIQRYLERALQQLNQRFGITKFEPDIRLEPVECPIADCPLKQEAADE